MHTSSAFSPTLLASLRRERGFSQPQLAKAAQVNLGTLRALEQGRITDPGVSTIARLASVLQISTDELLAGVAA